MDPILLVALVGKGVLEILNVVQNLQEQHANGKEITPEQAEELRNLVKKKQEDAEQAWTNA